MSLLTVSGGFPQSLTGPQGGSRRIIPSSSMVRPVVVGRETLPVGIDARAGVRYPGGFE